MQDQVQLINERLALEEKKKGKGSWGYEKTKNGMKISIDQVFVDSLNAIWGCEKKMQELLKDTHLRIAEVTVERDDLRLAWKEVEDFGSNDELDHIPAKFAEGLGVFLRQQIHDLLWRHAPSPANLQTVGPKLQPFRKLIAAQLDNLVDLQLDPELFLAVCELLMKNHLAAQLEGELLNEVIPDFDTKRNLKRNQVNCVQITIDVCVEDFSMYFPTDEDKKMVSDSFSYASRLADTLLRPTPFFTEAFEKTPETEYERKLPLVPAQINNSAFLVEMKALWKAARERARNASPYMMRCQVFSIIKFRLKYDADYGKDNASPAFVKQHGDAQKDLRNCQAILTKRLTQSHVQDSASAALTAILNADRPPEKKKGIFARLFGK